VWYENGRRRQCQSTTEAVLAARVEKITARLAADAPGLEAPGTELIAHYLSPDRHPAGRSWSRKHADTQQRLCHKYLEPVLRRDVQRVEVDHVAACLGDGERGPGRGCGDLSAVAYWEQAAADVWACVQAGNCAALEYLQREAGYTRSGYHGRLQSGISVGRWEDAHGFIVGSFAQHTSREGDPQLHIHNLVLNRVMRERDGAWRTLDSRALHEHRGAAAAIATLVMESALSRMLGTGWTGRADGHGREVRGVSRALMEEFSSRRQSISALTARLAAEFEAQHGFAPDRRALGRLRLWANHASRRAKEREPLDLVAEARRWAARARASEAGALEPVLPAVTSRRGPGARADAEPRAIWELSPDQAQSVMAQALARLQEAQPTGARPTSSATSANCCPMTWSAAMTLRRHCCCLCWPTGSWLVRWGRC
jgi:hypothetical protein